MKGPPGIADVLGSGWARVTGSVGTWARWALLLLKAASRTQCAPAACLPTAEASPPSPCPWSRKYARRNIFPIWALGLYRRAVLLGEDITHK